jgi:replicative DNA helicase
MQRQPVDEAPPPNAVDIERAVLGAMMVDYRTIDGVRDVLVADAFYERKHGLIYDAICSLRDHDKAPDPLTIVQELGRRNLLQEVGGVLTIASLAGEVASGAQAVQHAEIVAEKHRLRNMIGMGRCLVDVAQRQSTDSKVMAEDLVCALSDMLVGVERGGLVPMADLLDGVVARAKAAQAAGGHLVGVTTGISELDLSTGGLQAKDLVIVAARPSVGKSAFALGMARDAANDGNTVAVFSLEMSSEALTQRMLSMDSKVDLMNLRIGRLSDHDWDRINVASGRVSARTIYIDDRPGLTASQIRSQCRRLKAVRGLDLVIVDYLQLMASEGKHGSREQEVTSISRGLKAIAKTLNVPVVALSQLSRAGDGRTDKRPRLSDLRESGSIEQDADVVMFLWRPSDHGILQVDALGGKVNSENLVELCIAKQRNGPIGNMWLQWNPQTTQFAELAPMWQAPPDDQRNA